MIKVLSTGAVMTPGSEPGAQEYSYDELKAAVDEAGKASLKVACHAFGDKGARDAVPAGVASIEHGSFLSEETLQLMKQRGTFLVLDLYNQEAMLAHPAGAPPEYVEKMKLAFASGQRVLLRALELGIPLAFGTDAPVIPHGENARQFATPRSDAALRGSGGGKRPCRG